MYTSEKVYLVCNTSVDACKRVIEMFSTESLNEYSLEKGNYILFTLHRQENTTIDGLKEILMAVNEISDNIKVLFPAHLRTRKVIVEIKINDNIILTDPLGYKDFHGPFDQF